ncbi:hypothetical protein DN752_17995 [Echinicola strongylocentroti]|uniref:Uncharacterized protein n=1 Tax=Echinicola strongylocentroti TaxID=1795355 RepID=A0A2Z4INC0_9BACT|nr:hypothetical protein [Echinicola strongylocentroti]AWW31873.1 hypothetical protein DN752_17995 [Echinicola strongylocentroti]
MADLHLTPDITIKEIPMLMQTDMVIATLNGSKSETRRLTGLEEYNKTPGKFWIVKRESETGWQVFKSTLSTQWIFWDNLKCPYGKPGDIIWVREGFSVWPEKVTRFKTESLCDPDGWKQTMREKGIKWKPSIHMPKSIARIWLMVEDIRMERIQDITEEGAKAEGAEFETWKGIYKTTHSYMNGFLSIWFSIHNDKMWNSNPLVWVIKFRVLSTNGRPSNEVILKSHDSILTTQKGKEATNA